MVIKKYKTISSDNKNTFDEEVNSHLDKGWEILDNSYKMNKIYMNDVNVNVRVYKSDSDEYDIHSDSSSGYLSESFSQVLVYKDEIDCKLNFYDNGIIKTRVLYKNGKLSGDYISYDENGQKEFEGTYKNGLKDGKWTEWYTQSDGSKMEERIYKEDIIDGKWTRWYKNGQKSSEKTYKDGKPDGLYTEWYENGQKKFEWTYKDGKEDGFLVQWNEDGSVKK